jgi:hypothetical protein
VYGTVPQPSFVSVGIPANPLPNHGRREKTGPDCPRERRSAPDLC